MPQGRWLLALRHFFERLKAANLLQFPPRNCRFFGQILNRLVVPDNRQKGKRQHALPIFGSTQPCCRPGRAVIDRRFNAVAWSERNLLTAAGADRTFRRATFFRTVAFGYGERAGNPTRRRSFRRVTSLSTATRLRFISRPHEMPE